MITLSAFNAYGLMIALGIVAGMTIAFFVAKYKGFNPEVVFDICIWAVPLAIVGARVYFLIFEPINTGKTFGFWQALGFSNNKFDFSDGNFGLSGLGIYGGVFGAILGIFINSLFYKKKGKKETFFDMLDLGAPVMLLGQAIGRWGNFFNQELYGRQITDPAWQFFPAAVEVGGKYYQALFFYESMLNLIGAALLLILFIGKRRSFKGFIIICYMIWYGIVRSILEGFRPPEAILYLIPGILPVSTFVSILAAVAGVVLLLIVCYRARQKGLRIPILVKKENWAETGRPMQEWGEEIPIFIKSAAKKSGTETKDGEETDGEKEAEPENNTEKPERNTKKSSPPVEKEKQKSQDKKE